MQHGYRGAAPAGRVTRQRLHRGLCGVRLHWGLCGKGCIGGCAVCGCIGGCAVLGGGGVLVVAVLVVLSSTTENIVEMAPCVGDEHLLTEPVGREGLDGARCACCSRVQEMPLRAAPQRNKKRECVNICGIGHRANMRPLDTQPVTHRVQCSKSRY